jgi:hypothetical protein
MVNKKRFSISNKLAYTLIVVALIVGLGVGVLAVSPGVVPNPGHAINSISPPNGCQTGQVLTWEDGIWACTDSSGGSGSSQACTFCKSCGGSWPNREGNFLSTYAIGRGDLCAGEPYNTVLDGMIVFLCCN